MAATPILDLPLTSMTGWTQNSGAWSASASGITHEASGGTDRLMYLTPLPFGMFAVSLDVRLNGQVGTAGVSLGISAPGTTGSPRVQFSGDGTNVTKVQLEKDSISVVSEYTLSSPIPYGTWATLRCVGTLAAAAVYVDGTFLGSAAFESHPGPASFLSLTSYISGASWRNLKVWGPTVPW